MDFIFKMEQIIATLLHQNIIFLIQKQKAILYVQKIVSIVILIKTAAFHVKMEL